jgi:hypothetical protein
MTGAELNIVFSPLLPGPATAVLVALAAAEAALALGLRARGAGWRALALATLAAALLNPTLVREEREPRNDVAVVLVDESRSQELADRPARTEAALAALETELSRFDDLEVRVVRAAGEAGADGRAGPAGGTRLFAALGQTLADVPRRRVAGAIVITDGQVHDAPEDTARLPLDAPLHVLLTGQRGEGDRRLIVEQAPRFGLVGHEVRMTVRVDDPAAADGAARVTVRRPAGPPVGGALRVGRPQPVTLRLDHRGENVFELEVEPGEREMTLDNNRAVVVVNGVRERLRVLLVSGQPYAGERVWRNLLKSDPSVDLIHFTILRPPEKQDDTPVRELSLISFPIQELFEVKLDEFDLVIFDHYRRRGLLPRAYLANIVRYVREGGAVLEAAGPFFASPLSLYRTPLGAVLPGEPTGEVLERGFRPQLTATGRRHPVTADLIAPGDGSRAPAAAREPQWGRWFRQIEAEAGRGDVLMSGIEGRPLLILDRVGDGRVAQLLSDQIWLWARGFEGGGPQAELLRRLAHWLMKEPELEENSLTATVRGNRMKIVRHSLEPEEAAVTVTAPSGAVRRADLAENGGGRATAEVRVDEIGLYRLSDGARSTVAAVGSVRPLELADVRTTAERLRPAAAATGGAVIWLGEGSVPELRRVRRGRDTFGTLGARGRAWIGLLANRDYVVTGVSQVPLLPAAAVLLLALAALALAWRREGM